MSTSNKLTLLVFLKDRFAFTKRLCAYLQSINYPFHVIFADGSESSEHELYFKDREFCFSYEYIRYPIDKDIHAYSKKAAMASALVKTPYVMLCDNDDFPIISGQNSAIHFLDSNHDYVGCNGRVRGLIPYPDSSKPHAECVFWRKYYDNDMDYQVRVDGDSAIDRVTKWQPSCYSILYSIFRSEALEKMFDSMNKLDLSDFGPMELFFSYFMLFEGKVKSIDDTTYIRQHGSSQAAASQGKSFFRRLFYHDWLNDIRKIMDYMQSCYSNEKTPNSESLKDYLYSILIARSEDSYRRLYKSKWQILKFALERGVFIELMVLKLFRYWPRLACKISKILNKNLALSEVKAVENSIRKDLP